MPIMVPVALTMKIPKQIKVIINLRHYGSYILLTDMNVEGGNDIHIYNGKQM